jgi:hypothetical protein
MQFSASNCCKTHEEASSILKIFPGVTLIGHVPRTNRLDFGEDPDVFCGSMIILKVSLALRDRAKSRTAQLGGGDALYRVSALF